MLQFSFLIVPIDETLRPLYLHSCCHLGTDFTALRVLVLDKLEMKTKDVSAWITFPIVNYWSSVVLDRSNLCSRQRAFSPDQQVSLHSPLNSFLIKQDFFCIPQFTSINSSIPTLNQSLSWAIARCLTLLHRWIQSHHWWMLVDF